MTLVVTAIYNDLVTDTLYVASGSDVFPLFGGEPYTGTWRTKLLVDDFQPSFGWLRVNAEFEPGDSVVVRLYGDGVLFYSVAVSTKEPVRVPVGRFREWEVEVEGTINVVSVDVATDVFELTEQ